MVTQRYQSSHLGTSACFAGAPLAISLLIFGCAKVTPSFDSPEPAARNVAIVNAAAKQDKNAVPDLVRMLESDDPATRLLAIASLERIVGDRKGYDDALPPDEREAAIARWRAAYPQAGPATLPRANTVD